MALPDDIETVTVTGRWLDNQGNPCAGTVTFTPPCTLVDTVGDVILAGSVTATLDAKGEISQVLVCTDQDNINPTGWTYHVTVRTTCSDCVVDDDIALPCGTSPVDIAKLLPVATSPGVIVIRGPRGPSGAAASPFVEVSKPITSTGTGIAGDPYVLGLGLSTDEGNELALGADGLLYAPTPDGSETVVQAGDNATITGTGTLADPYVVAATTGSVNGQSGGVVLDLDDVVQAGGTTTGNVSLTPATGVGLNITGAPDGSAILNAYTKSGSRILYLRQDGVLFAYKGISVNAGANIALNDISRDLSGGGSGVIGLANATKNPTTPVSDAAVIYAANGAVNVLNADGTNIAVMPSVDDGNQLSIGTDDGLYVPVPTAVGDNTYVLGDGLEQSGSGTTEDPYTLSVDLSTDEGNTAVFGGDGGLYVPASEGGITSVTAADSTVTVVPTTGDVTVAAALSADSGNILTTGSDGALLVDGSAYVAYADMTPFASSSQLLVFNSAAGLTAGVYTDMPADVWPPLSFTVPASGVFALSLKAKCTNTNTTNSSIYCAYRISGAATVGTDSGYALGTTSSVVQASMMGVFTGTPGEVAVITPAGYASTLSTVSAVTNINWGVLTAFALPA